MGMSGIRAGQRCPVERIEGQEIIEHFLEVLLVFLQHFHRVVERVVAELYDTNQRKIFLRLKTFLQTTI